MAMTIDHAMEIVPELKKAYKDEPDTKKIIDLAKKMEGCVRHISVHAAGVVIAPRPIYEFSPVQYDPKSNNEDGKIITQYDMYNIEDAGLPKFDFLGIRNLSILSLAVKLVKQIHGIDIDIDKVNLEDKRTFEMLTRGETSGLFQLNGSGMTRYLKELRPSTIHDINAMVALYRPGPMETIPEYIERKHNPRKVVYADPRMKEYLEFSNGLLVYQDDVLMTSIKLGGYSWLDADKLRKAMGKKIPEVMEAEKGKLIKGFMEYGKLSKQLSEKLWTLIEPFAAYGFGKAHAASYGRVAYQTAYMKANYPVEYMTAILTSESGDIEKVAEIVHECEKMGIKVLPPNVNDSFGGFTVIVGSNQETGRTIRFGLYTIKNLGTDIADAIIEERKRAGKFKSLSDFFERINHKNLNKKSVEALAKSGALDDLGSRALILGNIETLLAFNKESRGASTQDSLFGSIGGIQAKLSLVEQPDITHNEKLAWEKDLLGLYISGHPLDSYKEKIEKFGTVIQKVKNETKVGMPVTIAAIIDDVRVVTTKNNTRMAFIKLSDHTGSVDAVVFSKLYEEMRELLVNDTIIALQGKVTERNGEKSIMIEKFKKI
jgi:DNA polymerase-3 subunit alpha